jgi:hypothetical protein
LAYPPLLEAVKQDKLESIKEMLALEPKPDEDEGILYIFSF